MVTAEGYLLTDQVAIPPDAEGISVSPDGQVFAQEDDADQTQIGTIRLYTFANSTGLKAQGGNYFSPTVSSGAAQGRQPGVQGTGTIRQGTLERSNVETVDELVALIVAQRNYEVNSRAIRVSDEMLQQVNQLVN